MLRFSLFGFPITVEPWFWLGTMLLDKISREGIDSLSVEERQALARTSAELKERSRR